MEESDNEFNYFACSGDYVICINNKDVFLTIGKRYLVTSDVLDFEDTIYINDDRGRESFFTVNKFITLVEWRDKQIDKICEING